MALCYVNGGFKALYSVALKPIFKKVYGLSPNQMQVSEAWLIFPWDFKILYGIIADTIQLPFFPKGTRKGWIVIFSFLETLFLLWVASYQFSTSVWVTNIFFMISLCSAFMDTTIDAITCAQQRKDPKHGA